MKRYLLGLSAVVLAVGFSAFTNVDASKKLVPMYWFQVSNNYIPSAAPAQADATFIELSEIEPEGVGCGQSTHQCVSGFTANQVQLKSGSSTEYELINNSQVPSATPRLKN